MTHSLGWIIFFVLVVSVLVIDLGLFNKKAHTPTLKEALTWSAVWISLALVFNIGIFFTMGKESAFSFLAGYLVEESLSIDNLFVFMMIFKAFNVPSEQQHKALFWGILGAIIMRAIFIFGGIALIERFHFVVYIFGTFLFITGVKFLFEKHEGEESPKDSAFIRWVQKIFPPSKSGHGKVSLIPVLILIEGFDLVFALDSVPAVLAITRDPFIVYTSNIFAILGLRSLYFALAGIMGRFKHLKTGLAIILMFVGTKMLIAQWYVMPVEYSLAFIIFVLTACILKK